MTEKTEVPDEELLQLTKKLEIRTWVLRASVALNVALLVQFLVVVTR